MKVSAFDAFCVLRASPLFRVLERFGEESHFKETSGYCITLFCFSSLLRERYLTFARLLLLLLGPRSFNFLEREFLGVR